MARKNTLDTDSRAFEATEGTATNKETGKSRRRPKTSRRSSDHKMLRSENLHYSIATPVWADQSLAMQSFGNFTTTPGQSNFMYEFNQVRYLNNDPDTQAVTIKPTEHATRTQNVMVLSFTPYFGATAPADPTVIYSPLDLAALNLKQFIDTSYGTKTDYDQQDLMLYLLAISAIFPQIAELKRDLRLVSTIVADQYPQFVPRGLFAALQIADDNGQWTHGEGALYTARFVRSYADQLNQLINAFNRLPIPPEMPIFGYNDDLFDAIYMDSEDQQTSQLYVFRTHGYWEYVEGATDPLTEPYLRYTMRQGAATTIQARIDDLANQIKKVSTMRTASNAMLQNLFNAYGSKDAVQIPRLDNDSLFTPVEFKYHAGIMTMIENALICDTAKSTLTNMRIRSSDSTVRGYLYLDNVLEAGSLMTNVPLQFHKPPHTITGEDVGWALRMRPMFMTCSRIEADTGTTPVRFNAGGYTGFAILRQVGLYYYDLDGNLRAKTCMRTEPGSEPANPWDEYARDFHAAPIDVKGQWVTDADHPTFEVSYYTANRDVEATYRLEDIRMHWTYLTLQMWAGDIKRDVTGTRMR